MVNKWLKSWSIHHKIDHYSEKKMRPKKFWGGQISGQANFWGQAKIWVEAKRRPGQLWGQANEVRPGSHKRTVDLLGVHDCDNHLFILNWFFFASLFLLSFLLTCIEARCKGVKIKSLDILITGKNNNLKFILFLS